MVDETDSKSVAADPASRFESGEGQTTQLPEAALGRPSRRAAEAALRAHLSVLRGEALRPALKAALKQVKGLGGNERRFAALATRELSRHQRLLDLLAKLAGLPPSDFSLLEDQALIRYVLWRRMRTGAAWERFSAEVRLPGPIRPRAVRDELLERIGRAELPPIPDDPAVRHSFPTWLCDALGRDEVLLEALNREPSLILRARPPGSRAEVLDRLRAEGVDARPLEAAPDALVVEDEGRRIFDSAPFREGRLQVMDLGSQLVVELCRPEPHHVVADLCAGAGGKTIALADRVATVYATDASRRRLGEGIARVRTLGLRNVRFTPDVPLEAVDLALIDAPCSGVGSLQREPDLKWKLDPKKIAELARTQLELLERTAGRLRSGARLVYATCSLLREENEAVVEALLARLPELSLEETLSVSPVRLPGGGFFAARLLRG